MRSEIRSFRDLIAWQKGIELCKRIYAISATFPDAERFGLISQIRRAGVSIPSNIAEGYGRSRSGDYVRFLNIARGSAAEIVTQLVLVEELGFADKDRVQSCMLLTEETDRVLFGLIRAVEGSGSS
ncbi:MAG: four helix bundle protein [Planctomycetes bacterium]|nr:four helix bundle protein [Planctomycetota bacterium]